MKLQINGKQKDLGPYSSPPSLSSVVKTLGHNPLTVVVEFNGIIINSQLWEDQKVKDGDKLEIVTIVGGGS